MSKARASFPVRGDLIGNRFIRASDAPGGANGECVSRCPGDSSDELGRFPYSYASIEAAISSARGASRSWRLLPLAERAERLATLRSRLQAREPELGQAIAREIGKPLWDARHELAFALAQLEAFLSDGMKMIPALEFPADGTLASCEYRPHGVLAVIGPFNLPFQAPLGHIVPALLTGNTVVFKPSEKAPLAGQLLAELFVEAGFPAGVFNLIQGEREVGRRLCVHEGVDGILFTGSYETGNRIKQDTLQQHWKIMALEMGGKNAAIVWEDADLELALKECLVSAFMTAGQRCNSLSRILVHESLLDRFVERFHERSKAFQIGHPLENPFMGPLIEQGAVDRYMKFVGIAGREGAEIVMRGKALELPTAGNYVTPSICVIREPSLEGTRKSVFQQTELLAPSVAVLAVRELEQAIEQANATQFGLVASVFARDRAIFAKAREGLRMGSVHWSRSTVSVSPRLPFGGLKKSGNHFPAGIAATRYCAYPVASLETPEPKFDAAAFPGLNWE
ncbi:MAG: aldehyde dehydrogenase family protein [Oligoflexia bacterium]|nr:aldehyde dehydrogenase family protein [Oligoflexia bacterium]